MRGVREELNRRWRSGSNCPANFEVAAVDPLPLAPPTKEEAGMDPKRFSVALDLHIRRHGDTTYSLRAALTRAGAKVFSSTLANWRRGVRAPQSEESLAILALIEQRYRLPVGYFQSKLTRRPRAVRRAAIPGVSASEMRRLSWHLPADFHQRPAHEQQEIIAWVRDAIITGSTEYRRFQAAALKHRYGLRFRIDAPHLKTRRDVQKQVDRAAADPRAAPSALNKEMRELVAFKTSTLTTSGYRRSGVWGAETADQRVEHLGLMFGALAAASDGPIAGQGVPLNALTLALLAFPAVWDWYVQ